MFCLARNNRSNSGQVTVYNTARGGGGVFLNCLSVQLKRSVRQRASLWSPWAGERGVLWRFDRMIKTESRCEGLLKISVFWDRTPCSSA